MYRYFLLSLCVAAAWSARAQNFTDPVVYNNYLIEEQTKLISKGLEYMSFSIHSEDYDSIERMRIGLLVDIRKSIGKVRRMPDFQGTNRLKRETIDVFENYIQLYETDLIEVLGLKKKYGDSYEALNAYMEAESSLEEKMQSSIDQLSRAQEAFAKRYDLKVQGSGADSQINRRILRISELSKYTRSVFMEYFMVSWKFNDMVEILHERDGKKLEKRRLEVIESSNEAMANLRRIRRFDNEKEYMDQTMDLIRYFQALCKKEFRNVVLIFNKDTMTQKDADYVNKVFADYNANIEVLVYNWNLANQYLWKTMIN